MSSLTHIVDKFVMSLISYIDPTFPSSKPLRPSQAFALPLAAVLLSKSHPTARGHSLGPSRMWQHCVISRVPHVTAPPTSTQKYHGKLHTCTTTTAKPVCTQRFLSSRQFQLSIQSHASRSHYSQMRLIF